MTSPSGSTDSGYDEYGRLTSATYTEGTTVYLRATATEGSEFVEWQMNGETVTAPVEISDDTTLTAVFDVVAPSDEGETPDPEEDPFSETESE